MKAVYIVAGIYALITVLSVALLAYFIIRRVKKKKLEDFEKRDN